MPLVEVLRSIQVLVNTNPDGILMKFEGVSKGKGAWAVMAAETVWLEKIVSLTGYRVW